MDIKTEIVIAAPPARVWSVLVDLAAYGEWNPFIVAISGPLFVGGKLTARIKPPGGRAMIFRPRVLVLEPERELRWLGHVFIPGLFDGEHRFWLEPMDGGNTTLFHQDEGFSGWLANLLMGGSGRAKTAAGFTAMNEALKRRAEALAAR